MKNKIEPDIHVYETPCGLEVHRKVLPILSADVVDEIAEQLDTQRGVLLTSDFEYPNRYSRLCRGFLNPPLVISARDRNIDVEALNERGLVLLDAATDILSAHPHIQAKTRTPQSAEFEVIKSDQYFSEAQRTQQPSVFSVVRALMAGFASKDDVLGLYGAFGYDLVFQFDAIEKRHQRDANQPDMVIYLPDEIVSFDHRHGTGHRYRYEFEYRGRSTKGLSASPYPSSNRYPTAPITSDQPQFPYADRVEDAKAAFKRGDLFEVVLTMTFRKPTKERPSAIFSRLRKVNPAPYGALLNLGAGEYLVSGSPEMFVRVTGDRVETCPISGTAPRGYDALEDSQRALALLNSTKDESELTMCTDVDRNDKARICVPGSVQVIGRRQIEIYSRVIHTVDHIEGRLQPEFDSIDAFLTHMWAVTVTGAPKLWAMRFIEDHEADPRLWYGGAFGYLAFDGNINTGLTLRTVRLKDGAAEIRAGSTLLYDSVPEEEEAESRLKASAFLAALESDSGPKEKPKAPNSDPILKTARILIIDCEDSFVLTLGDYIRQLGAQVHIVRVPKKPTDVQPMIDEYQPNLLLISPGPGRPDDFGLNEIIRIALEQNLPLFGVCLGLQGIVEYFGTPLGLLNEPMHGKSSEVHNVGGRYFSESPKVFAAGRYHSIFVKKEALPEDLIATGWTEDGAVMQVEHRSLPIAAVQFHPESIMTSTGMQGLHLLRYALSKLLKH